MERLAKAVELAAKYREESWVPAPSTDGETPQGSYSITLRDAADRAAEEVGFDEFGTIPVYLLLYNCWNDALSWAKSCLEGV